MLPNPSGSPRRRPARLLWLATLALAASTSAVAQGPATLTLDQIRDGLRVRHEALKNHRLWYVSYHIGAENREGDLQFAWPYLDIVNGRKGGRLYSYSNDPGFQGNPPLERWMSYDKGVGVERTNGAVSIMPGMNSWHILFNFYTDTLGIDTYEDVAIAEVVTATQYNVRNEPWLPAVIDKNPGKYAVLPRLERIDGRDCHVIEYPGFDKVWIDAGRGCCVVQRELAWHLGQPLRRRLQNLDHAEFQPPGIWLPRKQVVEQFCSLRDTKANWGKVAHRRVHEVRKIELAKVDDALLEIPIPEGVAVTDHIRKIEYGKLPPSEDPIRQSVEQASPTKAIGTTAHSRDTLVWVNAFLLCGVVLVLQGRRVVKERRTIHGHQG